MHDLIARGAPLRDVLIEILESIERYDPSVKASLLMLDPDLAHAALRPRAVSATRWLAAIDGVVIGPNVGTCGSAAWSGQLTVTEDIAEDPSWAPIRDKARAAGFGHCWSMPIKSAAGEVLGTLAFTGRGLAFRCPSSLRCSRTGRASRASRSSGDRRSAG